MKLGIVMPLWGREQLSRLTLQRCALETNGDRGCILVAVTDEPINGSQARQCGFEVVHFPNQPLSDKKNAGVEHLRGRVDGVIYLGSDDWIISMGPRSFLDQYRFALERHPFIGPLDMWYLDLQTGKAGHSKGYPKESPRHGEPTGAGRAMTSGVLNRVDWSPRPAGQAQGHDGGMKRKLQAAGISIFGCTQNELGIRLVDIKSQTSTTSYEKLRVEPSDWDAVLKCFPKNEVMQLQMLRDSPDRN